MEEGEKVIMSLLLLGLIIAIIHGLASLVNHDTSGGSKIAKKKKIITKRQAQKLGELTGNYLHIKEPDGNKIHVEVLKDGQTLFRLATLEEIETLTKLKFLK